MRSLLRRHDPPATERCETCRATAAFVVDAVWPIAVAATRTQVAAEIRAVDVEMVANLDGDTARVGLTVAAKIAEGGTP